MNRLLPGRRRKLLGSSVLLNAFLATGSGWPQQQIFWRGRRAGVVPVAAWQEYLTCPTPARGRTLGCLISSPSPRRPAGRKTYVLRCLVRRMRGHGSPNARTRWLLGNCKVARLSTSVKLRVSLIGRILKT